MSPPNAEIEKQLRTLFETAESQNTLEYIFTLLRVSGLSYNTPDPFLVLESRLAEVDLAADQQALLSHYRGLVGVPAPFQFLANLLRCAGGESYDHSPFRHLRKGEFPHTLEPTSAEMAADLVRVSTEDGREDLVEILRRAYPADTPSSGVGESAAPAGHALKQALETCAALLTALLSLWRVERLKYREWPRFHKMPIDPRRPRFEVLELLANDDVGLYGFRMHFSNGSSAWFKRLSDSTLCLNLRFDNGQIGFFVGNLGELRDEWRVGKKRLYEVGLPGRYNELGEWKPIQYPAGKADPLREEATSFSEDPDIQGAFFYMLCTGHRVIEFVVRASVELPAAHVMFGGKLHLWKCPPLDDHLKALPRQYVYDGWWELDSVDPDEISSAITSIGAAVNMMAFAYEIATNWRLKYPAAMHAPLCGQPKEDDRLLDMILKSADRTDDIGFVHAAIDWYARGKSARSVFVEFLCYYIALESVATAVAEGRAYLGLGYPVSPPDERTAEVERCIQETHDRLFHDDPEQFVRVAYFDCVTGQTRKVRRVVEHVLGPDHQHLKSLFQGRDSLTSIRGRLAHGDLAQLDKDDEIRVRSRISDMARVSREFLLRAMLGLTHDAPTPTWSRTFSVGLPMSDPRSFEVISDESMLPSHDWRIRPEWCE